MGNPSDTFFGSGAEAYEFPLDWTIEAGIRCLAGIIDGLTGNDPLSGGEFVNDVFEIRPYDWSEPEPEDYGENPDNPENWPEVKPNFKCGDFEVSWHKHLGRGSNQNKELTAQEIQVMFTSCMQSLADFPA